jgi:hypothetical protein
MKYFLLQGLRHLRNEYRAIRRLFHRSGLSYSQQSKILSSRGFHSSGPNYQGGRPNEDDKDKRDNDEKMSSVVAKVFLWIITAYMVVAAMSLVLPNSEQPEVSRLDFNPLYPLSDVPQN